MPDEPSQPTPAPAAAPHAALPALDEAKVLELIRQGTTAALEAKAAEDAAARQAQADQAAAAARGKDPVRGVVMDAIGDELRETRFEARAAADAAKFYLIHPEAKDYAGDIEKKFYELAASGNAQDRETVFYWMRGKDFDKFHAAANQQAESSKANEAMVPGPGGTLTRVRQVQDPYTMTPDELEKALDGVAF